MYNFYGFSCLQESFQLLKIKIDYMLYRVNRNIYIKIIISILDFEEKLDHIQIERLNYWKSELYTKQREDAFRSYKK